MIIVLRPHSTEPEIAEVCRRIEALGLTPHLSRGVERTIIGAIGDERILLDKAIEALPMVEQVVPILKPYKLASRDFHPENTVVRVGDVRIGDRGVVIIAGPCAVESRAMVLEVARAVRAAGAHLLRGGAYKPRTSPYAFQGLGDEGLRFLAEAGRETGMPIVTELMDPREASLVLQHVDIVHRIGRLSVGENILIIIVSAGHRPEAYAGSRYIIEEIKKRVPIWKKELTKDGGRWVPGEHGHGAGKPLNS